MSTMNELLEKLHDLEDENKKLKEKKDLKYFIRPESGAVDQIGPVIGPFKEFIQLTYGEIRIGPDGETIGGKDPHDGMWHFDEHFLESINAQICNYAEAHNCWGLEKGFTDVVIWAERLNKKYGEEDWSEDDFFGHAELDKGLKEAKKICTENGSTLAILRKKQFSFVGEPQTYTLPPELAIALATNRHQFCKVYATKVRTADPEKAEMARLIGDLLEDRHRLRTKVQESNDGMEQAFQTLKAAVTKGQEALSAIDACRT